MGTTNTLILTEIVKIVMQHVGLVTAHWIRTANPVEMTNYFTVKILKKGLKILIVSRFLC